MWLSVVGVIEDGDGRSNRMECGAGLARGGSGSGLIDLVGNGNWNCNGQGG